MIIKTENSLADSAQKSFLSFSEASGTNVIRWANPNAFQASWAVQIGANGEEKAEIVLLGTATPSGTAGTLTGNTLYEHPSNTPLYAIKYDQVVFEVSTAGTAGTATPIASGTVSITPDSLWTQFDHTAGSLSYGYKTYFRNSVLGSTSIESDWIVGTVPLYALGGIVERTRSKLWSSDFVTDDEVKDWTNEWNEKLNNLLIQANEDYNLGSVSVAYSGTTEFGTINADDFKQIRRVWFTTDGVNHYQMTKMDSNQFLPEQVFSSTNPHFFMFGNNIVGRRPNDTAGTAGVVYYRQTDKMVNDYDLLPSPVRAYTKSFVDYNLIQAQYKDSKIGLQEKLTMEKALEDGFKQQIAPRSKTGPTYIGVVDVTGGGDDYFY